MISRNEEFLDLYKQLEDALEEKYRGERRRYSSVVMEFSKDYESGPVRDKLDVCRELRNLLTHNPNVGGLPVAEPSEPVLKAMEEVLEFVKRPPLAMEFATTGEQIMRGYLDQKVLPLMRAMEDRGFSHIPILKNGKFYGVFSVGAVFRYLLHNGGKGISESSTLADLDQQIQLREHTENYEFVSARETYITVRKKFERVRGKSKRVAVIFVTETGSPNQKLLGMLTPWDVLGDLD